MSSGDLVRALWERMEARDWDDARATLADDFVRDYPASHERFPSGEAFIAINRAYPEGWSITVDEILESGSRVVAHVRMSHGDNLFHCLSFADVVDGRIRRSLDFWVDDGGDPAPDSRAQVRDPQTSEEHS
jgi:hypothetical protein